MEFVLILLGHYILCKDTTTEETLIVVETELSLDPLNVVRRVKDHAVLEEILHRGPYPDGHPAQPVWSEG